MNSSLDQLKLIEGAGQNPDSVSQNGCKWREATRARRHIWPAGLISRLNLESAGAAVNISALVDSQFSFHNDVSLWVRP